MAKERDSNGMHKHGLMKLVSALSVSTICFISALFLLSGTRVPVEQWRGFNALNLVVQPITPSSNIDWDEELRQATRTTPETTLPNGMPERWADRLAAGKNDRLGIPSHRVNEPLNLYHPEWPLEAPDPLPGVHMVYMYVNGTHPDISRLKLSLGGRPQSPRDRDNGELMYSLRSLDKYIPWFQGDIIILQGDDPPPNWLNLSHPRIKLVHHKDYFIDQENTLPTFSSDAIHANIHRVPGINEIWINWCDDFMLSRPVDPEDWVRDGKPVVYMESGEIWKGRRETMELERIWGNKFMAKLYNTYGLLLEEDENRALNDIFHGSVKHAPFPFSNSVLTQMADKWYDAYAKNRHYKFRAHDTVDITNLHNWYCQMIGTCVYTPQRVSDDAGTLLVVKPDDLATLGANLRAFGPRPPKFTTINDGLEQGSSGAHLGAKFVYEEFLKGYYEKPSQYELR